MISDAVHQFLNYYKCPTCNKTWANSWDSGCDDTCPHCDTKNVSPVESINLGDVSHLVEITRGNLPVGTPTGLPDSDGRMIRIGDVVLASSANEAVHGEWTQHKVEARGLTPVLTYLTSEKGDIFPPGYMASLLADRYDEKLFLFMNSLSDLRPNYALRVVTTGRKSNEPE